MILVVVNRPHAGRIGLVRASGRVDSSKIRPSWVPPRVRVRVT